MEDLHFEEIGNMPLPNAMQQHLQMKLGKPTDVQKTPSRGGLGMIVNESKTPGARSLQSLASARKTTSSVVKNAIPVNVGFEIFQDETEDDVLEDEKPIKEIEETPCSPIDTVDRCEFSDSLSADIVDHMLFFKTHEDTVLHEEPPRGDLIDPNIAEKEALAQLGVEEWDEYPPIDPASRIADDFNYALSLDEFKHEGDVVLEEGDYPNLYADVDLTWSREEMKKVSEELLKLSEDYDIDDLLAEEASIPI